MTGLVRIHGVLITYKRPDDLRHFLEVLPTQTVAFDTLVVVDNDGDPMIANLVSDARHVAGSVEYVARPGNMGPAGGIHAGIEAVMAYAADDDVIVLLDDDDPPLRDDGLEMIRAMFAELRSHDPDCAAVGLWGATLNKMTGRVRTATGTEPEQVDYLPGNSMPHYSVRALRRVGSPDPAMFFGFDDLELGLRLRDAGLSLYSTGAARENGLGHMVERRSASARVEDPTWRRYYSLRNSIIVLRSHGAIRGAIYRSLTAGIAKPLVNLVRSPRVAVANLKMNFRAIRDGWLGRYGKTIDPAGLPSPRRNAAPR